MCLAADGFFRSSTLTEIAKVGVRLALLYHVDPFVMLARPPDAIWRLHELTQEVKDEMDEG